MDGSCRTGQDLAKLEGVKSLKNLKTKRKRFAIKLEGSTESGLQDDKIF